MHLIGSKEQVKRNFENTNWFRISKFFSEQEVEKGTELSLEDIKCRPFFDKQHEQY